MTDLIWGWGAFVFGLVGMLLAVVTFILGVITFCQARKEYRGWKKREDERQYEIDRLKQDLRNYAERPFGEISFNEYTALVNRLLRLDLYTKNPFSAEDSPIFWALFNMVQNFQVEKTIEQKTKKPDDE